MLQYTFMQHALLISLFIALMCPIIGIFLVLRRYSMIGDTLAHSSLAGVALGLMTGFNPIASAFIFTSLSGVVIEVLRTLYKKYAELILVIVLSLSVGIAVTVISSGRAHANVESFLFGSILTVTLSDLVTVFILTLLSVVTVALLYSRLLFITFDEEGAGIAGVKVKIINYVFSILVAATVSISIRIVGVLVLSSLIALPVAAALQFRQGFKVTLLLSIIISVFDVIGGVCISYYIDAAPGGVTAILSVAVLLVVVVARNIHMRMERSANR